MPACPRKQIVASYEVGIYHCYNRCVRRAFLCGVDPVSGNNFEHRKDWILQRAELLASAAAVEVLDFAILDNHMHFILRNRPDIAATWSDEEVVRRWWQICPTRRNELGEAPEPLPVELDQWLAHPEKVQELRQRLSSISWFMRLLCQKIARRANREDQVTGKFFESRFRCQALLDDEAVLACSLYVDLNVVRADKAETPEESRYTSAYERILERKRFRAAMRAVAQADENGSANAEPTRTPEDNLWLSPIQLADRFESGADRTVSNPFPSRRLTNKGFLPMTLDHYLSLLDWMGRQIRSDKRGSIPAELSPILERLHVNMEQMPDVVSGFAQRFHSAVGRVNSMMQYARRLGRRWLAGICQSAVVFT